MTDLPGHMSAVVIEEPGGIDVLTVQDIETPSPKNGQVLIKVTAAGVNRPDIMQRNGHYPAPKGHSPILGLEVAGTVAKVGDDHSRFQVGDRVMALVNGGGYADFCLAEETSCLPVPAGLSLTEAAGLPETLFTVWHNVFQRGALKADEWFLVHGGTSGIGVAAIQLAKAFGAQVIATAGSQEKCDACKSLGADHVINYKQEDFVAVIRELTKKRGVDVILDMVGGDYIARNIQTLAEDGRLVNIALQNGSKAEIDFMRVMLKRLTLTGSTLRIRTRDIKGEIAKAIESNVMPLLADGRFKAVVDSTFRLVDVKEAHKRMESSQHIGKIILEMS